MPRFRGAAANSGVASPLLGASTAIHLSLAADRGSLRNRQEERHLLAQKAVNEAYDASRSTEKETHEAINQVIDRAMGQDHGLSKKDKKDTTQGTMEQINNEPEATRKEHERRQHRKEAPGRKARVLTRMESERGQREEKEDQVERSAWAQTSIGANSALFDKSPVKPPSDVEDAMRAASPRSAVAPGRRNNSLSTAGGRDYDNNEETDRPARARTKSSSFFEESAAKTAPTTEPVLRNPSPSPVAAPQQITHNNPSTSSAEAVVVSDSVPLEDPRFDTGSRSGQTTVVRSAPGPRISTYPPLSLSGPSSAASLLPLPPTRSSNGTGGLSDVFHGPLPKWAYIYNPPLAHSQVAYVESHMKWEEEHKKLPVDKLRATVPTDLQKALTSMRQVFSRSTQILNQSSSNTPTEAAPAPKVAATPAANINPVLSIETPPTQQKPTADESAADDSIVVGGLSFSDDASVQCVCKFYGDVATTVQCELCETWQHLGCYYPGRENEAPEDNFTHVCADCDPQKHQDLDRNGAFERMQAMLGPPRGAVLMRRNVPSTPAEGPQDLDVGAASKYFDSTIPNSGRSSNSNLQLAHGLPIARTDSAASIPTQRSSPRRNHSRSVYDLVALSDLRASAKRSADSSEPLSKRRKLVHHDEGDVSMQYDISDVDGGVSNVVDPVQRPAADARLAERPSWHPPDHVVGVGGIEKSSLSRSGSDPGSPSARWSEDDVVRLVQGYEDGKTWEEISEVLPKILRLSGRN